MKKATSTLLALVLVLTLALSMASCGSKDDAKDTSAETTGTVETTGTTEDTTDATDTNAPAGDSATGSLGILETVWNAIGEDFKFYSVGGNMNAGTAVEGAPASFGVESPEDVDNSLGFPAASISLIDEAANLIHGMNANTFTMAAYHVADNANLDAAVKAIDENLANRQWMCGFPELLVIITVDGEYVVSMFGALDLVEAYKAQVTTSYPEAVVALEKNMME